MGPLLAAATAAAARTRERRGGVAPVSSYAAAVQHNAHNLRTRPAFARRPERRLGGAEAQKYGPDTKFNPFKTSYSLYS